MSGLRAHHPEIPVLSGFDTNWDSRVDLLTVLETGLISQSGLMRSQNKESQIIDSVDSEALMSETEHLQSEDALTSMSTTYRIAGVSLDRTTAIVVLTATTSVIHITLARPLMVLNGIGSALLLIPHDFTPQLEPYRHETRDTLIAYTVVTFVGFYVVKATSRR